MRTTQEDHESYARYHSFMRGYKCGSNANAKDPVFTNNKDAFVREEYEAGWRRGTDDRRAVHVELCKRTGYQPTILR